MPPKEGFSRASVGAIGLLVERLVRAGAPGAVLGRPVDDPFAGVRFVGVRDGFGWTRAGRYAAGVARAAASIGAGLIEVHNRPEVALRLLRTGRPVTLILNNDPQGMRGARTSRERKALLRRLAGVATSSAWLRGRLMEGVGDVERPPVVLHNCIDLPPAPPAERERLILFAGRLVSDKGADAFVAACAGALPRLLGWRAEMIGADRFRADSPETPFVAALRPAAAAAGVVLRGHQPNAVVLDAMRRAAIVVMPSRWDEPFGLVAAEAMAQGAALMCSARGGLPEVAGEAAVYVDPDAGFTEALVALAQDEGRRAALAAAGRARAEGFGAAAAAARLVAWRVAVLACSPSPRPSPAGGRGGRRSWGWGG